VQNTIQPAWSKHAVACALCLCLPPSSYQLGAAATPAVLTLTVLAAAPAHIPCPASVCFLRPRLHPAALPGLGFGLAVPNTVQEVRLYDKWAPAGSKPRSGKLEVKLAGSKEWTTVGKLEGKGGSSTTCSMVGAQLGASSRLRLAGMPAPGGV